jgi:asparagine synthase (glutamine-hydrolysing)
MCGIVGIFSTSKVSPVELSAMTGTLAHRGPDATAIYINDSQNFGLGHRRLSILDLSEGANQPFHSADKRYVIVFNGEIFNFQSLKVKLEKDANVAFRTTCDTEVILEAFVHYGPSMVQLCEGMFSFAILDKLHSRLYLFRDRLGKKPLYYYQDRGVLVFASEIKAVVEHPVVKNSLTISREAIFRFLHLGYMPDSFTIYNEVRKFPAGTWAEFDTSSLQFHTFWTPETFVKGRLIRNEAQAISELQKLLEESVRGRLISDVPLGAFLSGGVDSSLVAAYAARLKTGPLKTFTIGFNESKFDESGFARKVANHLNAEHYEYRLSEKDALDILDKYVEHFDEPFYDTSAIPTLLVSQLARQQVKVVLTGDGGDELFMGYGSYAWAKRLNTIEWRLMRKPLQFALGLTGRSNNLRVKTLLEKVPDKQFESHIYSQEQGLFTQKEIEALLTSSNDFVPFVPLFESNTDSMDPVEKQALFDIKYYLKEDLLVKVDRASMYYGLECRCPLLDHTVVEYALSLHPSLKRRNGTTKWILREILTDFFPRQFFDRPKHGFSIPLGDWMKNELAYLIDKFLNGPVIERIGVVKPAQVASIIQRFKNGEDYLYTRIWVLILLHRWMLKIATK